MFVVSGEGREQGNRLFLPSCCVSISRNKKGEGFEEGGFSVSCNKQNKAKSETKQTRKDFSGLGARMIMREP